MVRHALLLVGLIAAAVLGAPTADANIRIATAGPMTGPVAWFGEQYLRAAGLAVEDLNAKGGVLGQKVDLVVGDDFCDPEQAVAVAHKLVSDGVVFVAGHYCSHSSIAAAPIYEAAGILQIAPGSASAKLTDEGGRNVFRVCGRDDRQGMMVGDYLAERYSDKKIAILNDGTTWGVTSANGVRLQLAKRGVPVALDEAFSPGEADHSALVAKMQAADIDILYVGSLHHETALIFREAHDRGYDLQLVANSAAATADFPLIAGPEIAGMFMVAATDAREHPQAASVVARFRSQGYEPLGYTLYAYAAVQVWAQAVAAAGSLDLDAVVEAMHGRKFDTVLGRIGFDAKGDVTDFEPWQWYVWQADGTYVPLEQSTAKD
jgi:branched-chain amino acid transport system substrate-binding protein